MSTVVGNLSLNARENQIGSLFFDVQSDENFRFKIVKVPRNQKLSIWRPWWDDWFILKTMRDIPYLFFNRKFICFMVK
ncbi:hypothetical protein Q604_UNBc4C00087G0002 [human gut metagenome]|uniref:Uncharacterized protein n=2 Tax=root TaxID=1 RepID=W1WII2_9ZZZZ